MVSTKMSNTFAPPRNVSKYYQIPFAYLVEGLERYIGGGDLDIPARTISSASKLFLEAYEWCHTETSLPKLIGKYQQRGAKDRIRETFPAHLKFKELYEKVTGNKLNNEREIGLTVVRFIGLLDNLENETTKNKKERRQYKLLLDFSRSLLKDSECQRPTYLERNDDD